MANKSGQGSLDADFPPLSDAEIAAYADQESLSLADIIGITNGQIRPGKVGYFVVSEQEISLLALTEFELATVSVRGVKEMTEDIEASRLRLPCTPYEFVEWAKSWVILIQGGYKSTKFDDSGDVKVSTDFRLPAAFEYAVAIPKKPNETPDERAVRCFKEYEREARFRGKRGALMRAHERSAEKITRQYFSEICQRGRKILERQGESQG